ncbi:MAG TPA: glutamine--tRNA ligase/YqeY domain fusion protein [Longimicrobiales bacterium]|nr:glutamine--tRNA ligase/YqeY domain fusion protein [Longimicrobiales bacterium]
MARSDSRSSPGRDFIRQIIDRHEEEGRYDEIVTRFPPEPNGYLHIGHAKSICLNFGLAREYQGRCHLRFDDTNPLTEEDEYIRAIQRDVRWLGFDWGEDLYFASDYFERMYEVAEGLIRKGKAYVDSSSEAEIREARGTVTEPGRPTPDRDRSVEENLDLFRRMRAGEFPDGSHVLRGKIDLASPNMIMRDPVFYRIRHAAHHRTGEAWCIYPLYDYAHCLEDAFEGISHSLCTLEFDNNREIYDWILDEAGFREPRTHQYEFARLELDYTVLSKRKLIRLVKEGHVDGWDDPRLPTLAGLRRRGVPPAAIRTLCDMVGVAKANSTVDVGKLEFAIRDTLNPLAPRLMGVIRPLKVILTDRNEGSRDVVDAPLFPDREDGPTRPLTLGRELWIEADDFAEDPPKGWKRLSPGAEVRLRHGYVIRCDEVERDAATGEVTALLCTHDPDTLGANPDRKIGGTIHWLSAEDAVPAEFRLYDRLYRVPDPDDVPEGGDFTDHLNPDSLTVARGYVEPFLAGEEVGELVRAGDPEAGQDPWDVRVQLERLGYFARDVDFTPEAPVLNRIVTMKDTWGKRAAETMAFGGRVDAAAGGEGAEGASGAGAKARERGTPQPAVAPRVSEARNAVRAAHPALAAAFRRYQDELGVPELDADVLTGSHALARMFDQALEVHGDVGEVTAWVVNEVARFVDGEDGPAFDGAALGTVLNRLADGTLNRRGARAVLEAMADRGGDPDRLIAEMGLEKMDDVDDLKPIVDNVLAEFDGKVAEYRDGNRNLFGLFMGQVMRRSGGKADPGVVRGLLEARLGAPPEGGDA